MDKQRYSCSVRDGAKLFDLLEVMASENTPVSVPSLAKQLGITKHAVLRLLSILEVKGLVEADTSSGTYRLGLNSITMAQHILKSDSLIRFAHPVMEELARKLDEAIYITVVNNDEVLFLDMVDSLQQIRAVPLVGCRFPIFSNAAGKVIKATSSFDIFEKMGKKWIVKAGVKDIDRLERELDDIRRSGVAVDDGGLGSEICSVAVAVRDYAGKVVGALTMLAPSFRMLQERLENEIIPSMQESAEKISMKFGYAKIHA